MLGQGQVLQARQQRQPWQGPWLHLGLHLFCQRVHHCHRAKAAQDREFLAAGQGLIAEPQAQEHLYYRQPQQRAAAWAARLPLVWRAWQPLAAGQKMLVQKGCLRAWPQPWQQAWQPPWQPQPLPWRHRRQPWLRLLQ